MGNEIETPGETDQTYIEEERERIHAYMRMLDAEMMIGVSVRRESAIRYEVENLQQMMSALVRWEWGETRGGIYKTLATNGFPSPYSLNEQAARAIEKLTRRFDADVEALALAKLNLAESTPNMSRYQLSLTYKSLGDCYAKHDKKPEAVSAYRKGLDLNEKLPVKRKIKELEA